MIQSLGLSFCFMSGVIYVSRYYISIFWKRVTPFIVSKLIGGWGNHTIVRVVSLISVGRFELYISKGSPLSGCFNSMTLSFCVLF